MKFIVTTVLALTTIHLQAQKHDIIGVWMNEEKTSKIRIYAKGDRYAGKIIWLKEENNPDGSPKRDVHNPDENLRDQPILGLDILNHLKWDADDEEWDEGEIYDPRDGKTYSLYAWLEDPNTLVLKGYVGFSLIGKSTEWTRVDE